MENNNQPTLGTGTKGMKLEDGTIESLQEIRKTFGEMNRPAYRFLIVVEKMIQGVKVQVNFPSMNDTSAEYASLSTTDGLAIAIAV
jgi:hypothetical protein